MILAIDFIPSRLCLAAVIEEYKICCLSITSFAVSLPHAGAYNPADRGHP